ncbi:hypothetical protein ACHRVW_12080 [Flavobacterium collinsii]|uniref:hypothetical protein n=1 Tax=Flavobacterium collinsii TaxID=1114861 RepID=UPI003756B801
MKSKTLYILMIISSLSACNNNTLKEKSNVIEGTYETTETGLVTQTGIWVFSRDEITILIDHDLKNPFSSLGLVAVQKYYIKDDIIYTCLCNSQDCLDKGQNYQKLWKIESISQTNNKGTILLTNVYNPAFKVKLEKDKGIGLEVKNGN